MSYPVLYQWKEEIGKRLPCLNPWQVENVGLFSIGIMRAESCQQQVATGEKVESCARRWRRFLDNDKLPLTAFFSEWTAWVVSQLPAGALSVLVDETKLYDRIGTMMVGVAWEGRCIPLAWRCYQAHCGEAYPAEGQVEMIAALLQAVKAGIPELRQVIVLADRGIGTSPDLCRAVEALGWHSLFRVTSMTKVCTDFEYAQRNWQEQSFRDLKSGGWQWADSRITHPDHMANLLVLLALTYAWALALGSVAVAQGRTQPLQRHHDGSLRRHWSLFKEGIQFFFEQVLRFDHFIALQFFPDPRGT